jgi:RNA polymerase sigma-70 factor, ECF subfamily
MITDEEKLVLKLKGGDVKAFEILYAKYSFKIYNFCLKLLPSSTEAEEVVQKTFISLWDQRRQIDEKRSFGSYIYTIARYIAYKTFRRLLSEKINIDHFIENEEVFQETTGNDVYYNELVEVLDKIIDRLPAKRKEIFRLNRIEGLTYKETAQKLGISENTVDTQMRASLKFLKEEYNKFFQ